MKVSRIAFGLLGVASAVLVSAQSHEVFAQDAYDGCTCVTAPGDYSEGAGQIVFANGEVLVNNAGAASGQILSTSSEIMVGAGSASYSVGVSCLNTVGANTIVSISQPAGLGSDLCVKVSSMEPVAPPVQMTGSNLGWLALLGGVGGAALLLSNLGDDGDGKNRPPASP